MILLVHADNDYTASISVNLPASCLDITYCNIQNGSYRYGYDYCIFLVLWYTADDASMPATVEIHLSFLHPSKDLCIRPLANGAQLIQRSKDHLLLLFW